MYTFRVEARNEYGYSVFSNLMSVLAAQEPNQPNPPTTIWSPDKVTISWASPNNGGSSITGYKVLIRQSDLTTFVTEPTSCDMTLRLSTQCTIPVTTLIAAPFSLPWGSSVFAKVSAKNVYGESSESA